jgi:hypothetical protein
MNFSYLQHAWDAANVTLQDLMSPVVDCAANPNNRSCPICLNPVLSLKFGIPAFGHPMHMRYWRSYRDQMTAHNQVVACPVLLLYATLILKATVTECGCEVSAS